MASKFVQYFIKHSVVTNWIVIIICLAGVFALINLQKRINPKFELEEVEIDVPFPGASALEVEEGIVVKIEEALRGMEGIEKIRSTSADNWGSLDVEISEGFDMNKAIQDIKNAVNSINSYPTEAEKPIVTQETMWNRAIMVSIYGPDDLFTLKKIVEEFRDDLYKSGKMSNIWWWGIPNREFSIEISPEDLIRYKLTVNDISVAIRNASLNLSSGSVLTDQEEILIRTYEKKYEAIDFETIEVVSSIDGRKILLRDICTVVEQWPENRLYSEHNGKKSVGFNVFYNNNEDVVEIVETVEAKMEEYQEKYAGLVEFKTFIKETTELEERIDLMTQNGMIGLILVLLLLGFFLNIRLAFWVAIGIPISLLGMFFVLWTFGITINEMSLFGIILVIGILVDDGIIIGESIYSHWEKYGKKPLRAAIDGTLEVIKPVTISIITTMVAFVPYFFFYGMLGKHVWQIAAVVIISLAFSLVEAMIILPAHIAHSRALLAEERDTVLTRARKKLNKFLLWAVNNFYRKLLEFGLRNRLAVSATLFAIVLVIFGLFSGSHVRSQFFPDIEPPYARVQVEMPAGTSAEVANKIRYNIIDKAQDFADEWEKQGKAYPITNFTSWMQGGTLNIFIVLPSSADRDYSIGEFSQALGDYIGTVPEAEGVTVGGWQFGGRPISVRFASTDYNQLFKAKELLKEELKKIDGVKDIQDDTPLGNNEFIVELKPKGKALGFTARDLTTQLRQGFYGQEVMRLQRGRDELKVWVRFTKEDRISISQIENLKVRTPTGEYVPFKEVASFRIERGLRRIRHEDGERSVTVFADLDYSKNDQAVVLNELNANVIPSVLSQVEGVTQQFGGQAEYVDKMVQSIYFSMAIALFVMFTILMFLLKSYMQTLLVMGLIPLGVIGAVLGHFVMGIPVSILSFLGIVALAGIIVNDSVVLIHKYNNLLQAGMDVPQAIVEAGIARFRPIVLTTITTVAGLAPIILLRSEQGQFLVPMAVSVAGGILFGSFITLLLLPSSLYVISDLRRFLKRNKSRRELEPAYLEGLKSD
ncbi:MAG: efflux RND transporter permease subunit [Ignavibacteriaceae bacterium]|nr:efflux RND transporter permease subunit [Ignavibacteria bacterium]NNJ52433.1 efflux RND transporter permease subunit [Ignavibacteriaceae bacterium]